MTGSRKPRLRAVESIVVPDPRHGKILVLRDTQGIAKGHVAIPPAVVPIVARFDGTRTVEELSRELSVPIEIVTQLADDLDRALMLVGPTFDAAPDVDTFLVFGTSHALMREPFALLRKGYDTPLGPMPVDEAAVDALAAAARFDPYRDMLNHKREHSIEFQAAFLRHVLGKREARIIPILAGLGSAQSTGTSPRKDSRVAHFFDALRSIVEKRAGRVVVIAGADLAHVGPRFGDPSPKDEAGRTELEARDRESLRRFGARENEGFWEHVAEDRDERRVCGLGPMMSMLEVLGAGATSPELLHYEQTIDEDDGSIVSHAALALRANPNW